MRGRWSLTASRWGGHCWRKQGFSCNTKSSVSCCGRCFWGSQHLVPQTLPAKGVLYCSYADHSDGTCSLLSSISWDKCHSLVPGPYVCQTLAFGTGPCGMKYEPLLLSYSGRWAQPRRQISMLEMLRGTLESPELLYISWALLQNALGTFLHCSGLRSSHEALKKLWVSDWP